jgi:schlafen family protein
VLSEGERENTKVAVKELFGLWDKRSSSYGNVLFCSAIAKASDGKWHNVTSFLLPMHKEESRSIGVNANYGEFQLVEGAISLDQAKSVLTEVVEKDRLCLLGLPEVSMQASLHQNGSKHFWASASRRYPVLFPYYEFSFSVHQEYKGESPRAALHHVDLPLFPSGAAAMEELFQARIGDDSSVSGWFAALAPDYRGRIRQVRLGANAVEVQVMCLSGSSEADLIGKLHARTLAGLADCADLIFSGEKATTKISAFPRDLLVVLLSKKDGDLVDRRQFLAGSRHIEQDVVFEVPEQNIEQTILLGESETVEFKREIPARNKDEIAVCVVALANRRGGQLLLGVTDNGEVVGCQLDKPKDTITQILRSYCDPFPNFVIDEVSVRGMSVLLVTVTEGRDKPYGVKEKGFYIRVGATNRLATRYELDEMYSGKQNLFGQ